MIEPPGPEITFRLSLAQAIDVFEAYKGARARRPRTTEVCSILRQSFEDCVGMPYYTLLRNFRERI